MTLKRPMQRGLPSQEEGGYRLDLVREEGNDFSPYLHFPGPLAPRYPVNGYARTAEFRRMLEGLDLTRPLAQWQGHYFYAHVGIAENDQEFTVNFCACDNGIRFRFPDGAMEIRSESVSPCLADARRDASVGHVGAGIWRDVSEAVLRTGRLMDTSPPSWELRSASRRFDVYAS